jgi:O-antigen/teichoic acid export membrane protein
MGLFYIIVAKTNALTQTDIGILSILTFVSSTFVLLTTIALPTAITKFTSERLVKNQEEAASINRTVTKTVLITSLAGIIISACLSESLSQYFWGTAAYTILIILILIRAFLSNIIALCNSRLQALYLFGKMALVTLTLIVVSRAIGAALALLNTGLQGVVIGYIIGSSTAMTLAITFIRGKLPKTSQNAPIKPILKFSLPLFFSSLTLLILNWADMVALNFLTGDYALVGIYYIAVNSVTVLSILWTPVTTTIFPALSAKQGQQKPEDITNILKTSSRYLIYIVLPSCIFLAVVSQTALAFFYSTSYTLGAIPLSILSVTAIIIAIHSLLTTTLTAIGKTTAILKINVILAISTILTLIAIVPFLQIVGAALARLTTQIVGMALAFYMLQKEISVKIDKEALWKSTLASLAIIPPLLILETTISTRLPVTQTLAIEILTTACIYGFSLYILKALKTQDFELLRQALPKSLAKIISLLEKVTTR